MFSAEIYRLIPVFKTGKHAGKSPLDYGDKNPVIAWYEIQ